MSAKCRYRKQWTSSYLTDTGLSQAIQVRFHLISAFDVEEALPCEFKRECWFYRKQVLECCLRCRLIAEMSQRGYEMSPRPILGIGDLHGSPRPNGCVLKFTAEKMGQRSIGEEAPAERIVGAQAKGLLELFDRLVEKTFVGKRIAEAAMRNSRTWIEFQRLFKRTNSMLVLASR